MKRPLVSVIVPSFNQGRYIEETLESIVSQNHRPIEVLVMDGASTDGTLEVLRRFSKDPFVSVVSEPDRGVVDAVNKGLARAQGDILAIQSSDDTYLPGAIANAVAALEANPQAGLAFGDVELMDEHSRVTGRDVLEPFRLEDYLGRLTYIPQPAAFFRASAAREAGRWRAEVGYAADADYWMRIALRHQVLKIDCTLARYRYHPEQRDKHADRILRDWERAVSDLQRDPKMTPGLRRSIRMGVHLARYRYAPASQWARRTLDLYAAALANPRAISDRRFPKRELLPGRSPIWSLLSRLKRRLGFRPRGA